MHPKSMILAVALLAVSAAAAAAQSARQCGPRDAVLAVLGDRYGESRQAIGLGANNQVVEVFASDETGTWTITVTAPSGLTCLIASGESYETLSEAAPGAFDPAL